MQIRMAASARAGVGSADGLGRAKDLGWARQIEGNLVDSGSG